MFPLNKPFRRAHPNWHQGSCQSRGVRECSAWQELQLGWDLPWMFYQWNETQTLQAGKGKATFPKAWQGKAGSATREGTAGFGLSCPGSGGVNKFSVGTLRRPHSLSRARQKKGEKEKILVPSAPFSWLG